MTSIIKTITLSERSWAQIHYRIAKEYPPSYLLIREITKDKLGFTSRRHREWVPDEGTGIYDGYGEYKETIKLDFYSESKKTFFLLKFSDLID